MRAKVPQNVQREDTIIGPLTLKQMGILGAGGSVAYMLYITISKKYLMETWLPPVAVVTIITLAVAFLKIHSLTFTKYILRQIEHKLSPRKKIWVKGADTLSYIPIIKKEDKKKEKTVQIKPQKSLDEITKMLDK